MKTPDTAVDPCPGRAVFAGWRTFEVDLNGPGSGPSETRAVIIADGALA